MCHRWHVVAFTVVKAALTPFPEDPTFQGVRRFQEEIYIPEAAVEDIGNHCSSLDGQCRLLRPQTQDIPDAGIFSLFGALDGELGFFVQDEVSAYFGEEDPARERGPQPGRCVHVSFDQVPPWQVEPPTVLQVTPNLQMQLEGQFALGVPPVAGADRRPQQAKVHLEVEASIVYIRFVEQPVIVEKLWLSRDLPLDGHAAFPIILRGRHNVEEYWSVYLRYVDFLEQTWVSPAVTPVPISEIVILGGQGLRIGSLYLSVLDRHHAANATDAIQAQGWLMAPAQKMLSLHDVLIGKLPVRTHSAVLSLGEVRRGALRLRPDLLADPTSVAALEVAAQLRSMKAKEAESPVLAAPVAQFSDARTTASAIALLDALLTGALKFPEDIPLEALESDANLYASVYGEVTLEEAANARGMDDLYERLFTAHRMDSLDLLFSHFLWANFTAALEKPGGVMAETTSSFQPVNNRSWLPLHENSEVATRRRLLIAHLQEHTALFLRWQEPIEGKLAFVNSTGSVEVTFRLYDNLSLLGVDYYNAASGKSVHLDLDLPDSEYFLAELLGLASQLLVDEQGRPLSPELAQEQHEARTYLDSFAALLMELQQNTSEVLEAAPERLPLEDDFQLVAEEDVETAKLSNTPPMLLALGVSCFVLGTVLLAALGPAPERWPFARLWQSLGRLVLFVTHVVGRLMRPVPVLDPTREHPVQRVAREDRAARDPNADNG